MKSTLLGIALFFSLPAWGRVASRTELHANTAVRVLLDKAGRNATLQSSGPTLYAKTSASGPWFSLGKTAALKWIGARSLTVKGSSALEGSVLFVRGGTKAIDPVSYGERSYRGLVKFLATEEGWLAVNVLPLEEYLAGTLAAEMNASWHIEALKAQAVASRTYALHRISHPKSEHYDLLPTTEDQVYSGASAESARIRDALDSTRGEFLASGEKPARVFFHARCGGSTETEDKVWSSGSAEHVSVPCPYCRAHPLAWSHSVNFADLVSTFALPKSMAPPKLSVLGRGPSGRIARVKLESGGKSKTFEGNHLRAKLGYQRVKSTHFNWTSSATEIRFSGVGSGHGVGMCQWGASHLARGGKTYRQILAHFYPSFAARLLPQAKVVQAKN